ncbi:MAG: hypothetical protein Q7V14_01615, partial [Coriobacteriia bacterium]|nr:hypothetical protein [Coriobacteriia bacterium]
RDTDDYRLSENPFYLKLCSRVVFDPDDDSLVSGMYLPLDYWKRLCTDDRTLGPRSGRLVSFENASRYFDNTSFTRLVAGGWVGTNVHQTDLLDQLVREIVATGRAVVLATKEDVVVDDNDFISIDDWNADG